MNSGADSEGQSSASADAYKQILALLAAGELEPGEVVNQRELGRRVGLTTTPVREALRRLEGEGLLASQAGAIRVQKVTEATLVGQYAVRAALAVEAVQMFVDRASDREMSDLAALADQADQAVKEAVSNDGTFVEVDLASSLSILRAITRGTGCPELIGASERAIKRYLSLRGSWYARDAPASPGRAGRYRRLARVIDTRDKARATAAVRKHLEERLRADLRSFRRAGAGVD